MTVSARGGGSSPFSGQDVLREALEMRAILAGLNEGDSIGNPIFGVNRYHNAGVGNVAMWAFLAGSNVVTLSTRDGHRCADWNSNGISPGQNVCWAFRPGSAGSPLYMEAGSPAGFRPTFPSYIPSSDRFNVGYAIVMSAWMRKKNAGDTSDCRFTFGFANNRVTSPSRRMARCGLLGDGAGGYRFGSVNCPDAFVAGAANNAPGDIDANAVQPAELVAPGTTWWKVALKMTPATPTTPLRWAAYFNNALVATFTNQANIPRGHQGVSDDNSLIEASILNMQSDTAGLQIPTPLIDLLTVTLTDDLTI
jgi:hypothetical protein